jgi:hypothetical protein
MPNPIERFANINDIVADINSSIKLLADDASLYMIVDDPVDAAESLNTNLAKIHDWSMNSNFLSVVKCLTEFVRYI